MKRLAIGLLLFAGLWMVGGGDAAVLPTGPLTSACPATGSITLDGRLDERAWNLTVVASEMRALGTNRPSRLSTTFRFLYTDEALLLGAECETRQEGRQLAPKAKTAQHDDSVFGDDSVELFLQPVTPGPYYQFAVNLAGVRYEGRGFDKSWDGQWSARTSLSELGWQLEARIPYGTLGLDRPPEPGTLWRFNLCRNDRTIRATEPYHTWAELRRSFHEPEHFGALRFVAESVGAGPVRLFRRERDIVLEIDARSGPAALTPLKAEETIRTPAGQFQLRTKRQPGAEQRATLSAVAKGAWVANGSVLVAYTLTGGEQVLLRPAMLTVPPGDIRPERPPQPVPVVIRNDQVALTFDRSTGYLLSVQNKRSGLNARFGEKGTHIVELDAVRYIKHPRFFRDEDVQTIVPGYETLAAIKKSDTPQGQRLDIEHRIEPDVHVKLSITVPRAGVETVWRIELDNRLTYQPSRALVVHRVRYPILSGVPEAACGADPYVVLPALMGQKYPEPGKNLGSHRPLPYIGHATMGWFDFYGANGGLYFKVGDVEPLPQTDLIAQSDVKTRKLRLAIQRWSLCWPGEKWTPGPCGLGVHEGDWHAAADLYRSWFRRTFKLYQPPRWLKEADGYVMSGVSSYEFADFPRAVENAKAIGLSYIELWCEMTGGERSYYAFGFPNPYMGTPEELKDAIRELHERGGHIGFYLNFNTGDPLMGTMVRQPRIAQKIPEDIPRPALDYMRDNWIQQSLMGHDGSYSKWGGARDPEYLDGYWNACPAAKKWTDYFYYWVIEKWAKEYGADVWYLDSCPASRGCPCFAFDHGHKRPMPEGQAIINFFKRLRAGAPKDFCIMHEMSSDRLLVYATHALGLPWHVPFAHPEVVRYTLPEYPLFSGMCNGTAGVAQFYPGEKVDYKDALERVFLIGNRYEMPMSNRPPEFVKGSYYQKMCRLRRACRPEMNYGDFLDDIGLGPLPDHVHARLFRRADRRRLVVTLLDRRKGKRTPLAVGVDLKAAGVGTARSARLITLGGERQLDQPKSEGSGAIIAVPPYEGRPAALLIETEAPDKR